jgi:hypothetical protein
VGCPQARGGHRDTARFSSPATSRLAHEMDASLETLVTATYVFACSLSIPRPGPRGNVSDQELIAPAVAQTVTGLVSDRQFLSTIECLLPGRFPEPPGQSQFNRRLRHPTPYTRRPRALGSTGARRDLKFQANRLHPKAGAVTIDEGAHLGQS